MTRRGVLRHNCRTMSTNAIKPLPIAAQNRPIHESSRIGVLLAPEPVIIDADEGRVRQVIDNLLGNAVSHTPDEAAVTVTVPPAPAGAALDTANRSKCNRSLMPAADHTRSAMCA